MRRNKKIKWIILGICAVALVGWGALMVAIFGGDPKKPAKPTGTPTPTEFIKTPGTVVVWCMTDEYERDADGVRYHLRSFEYDDRGRCVKEIIYQGTVAETEEELKKVKTCTYDEETHYATWREPYMGSAASGVSETSYDSAGTMRVSTDYSLEFDGTSIKRFENTYDECGRLQSGREFNRETGEPEYEYVIKRDINGEILSEKSRRAQSDKWEMTMSGQTDELGRAIEVYDVNEISHWLNTENQYLEDGSRTSVKYRDGSNEERYIGEISVYDRLGRRTESLTLSENGQEEMRITSEYLETPEGTTELRSRYIEKDLNQTVEIRRNRDGKVTYLEECRFDETCDGRNCLLEVFYDENGRVTRVVNEGLYQLDYAYDEHGNCVMITETMTGGDVYYLEYEYTPVEISEEQAEENKLFYQPEQIEDQAKNMLLMLGLQ